MTQDIVQLYPKVWVGSGRAIPLKFTGRLVTDLLGIWDVAPPKRDGRNALHSSSSMGWNATPMSGATHCTETRYFWRYFCMPVYAVCGYLTANPVMMATKTCHPSTFFSNHRSCAASIPTNPLMYLPPLTTCRPYTRKNASNHGTFCEDMT